MVCYALPCLWITAVITVTVASPAAKNIRQERNLMVVLPVLQGRNISGDKLQYVYTKAPITMMISDTEPTTHRPISTKSWPASFASKAQVFLVEPIVRRTSPHHNYYPEWVRNTIPTTQRPNYSAVFHLAKVAAEPTNPPAVRFPSEDKYNVSVSKVTWKKSTDESLVKWKSAEDLTSTQSTPTEGTLDISSANLLQYNSSTVNISMPDDKTIAQLAFDLQTSTNQLTSGIKSMLLYLGLMAQGPSPQADTNELGSENTNSNVDSSSYMQFKNIPVRDEMAVTDGMRQLLNTFGLLSPKNQTNSTDEPTSRLKRDTNAQGAAQPSDVHQLFSQTENNSSKNVEKHDPKGAPLKSGLENSTIKPLAIFGRQKYRVKDLKRARAVDTGAAANRVESKDSEPSSNGTASVEQLSGSFGGEAVTEKNETSKPTNGLYFWVDWNTFFNLTGKPDVRLAYSSKAGDSTKFIPFTDWRTKL